MTKKTQNEAVNLVYILHYNILFSIGIFNISNSIIPLLLCMYGLFGGLIPYVFEHKCFLVVLKDSCLKQKNLVNRVYTFPMRLHVYGLLLSFMYSLGWIILKN